MSEDRIINGYNKKSLIEGRDKSHIINNIINKDNISEESVKDLEHNSGNNHENSHEYIDEIILEHNKQIQQKLHELKKEKFIENNVKNDYHEAVFFEKPKISEGRKRKSFSKLLRKLLDPPKNPYKRIKEVKTLSGIKDSFQR
ncbi:MAG: hypothetical protein ISP24_00570 [Rickettsiales bacterium]|nr:hypothetical protein [Rickettsiales bacterium]